MRGMSIVLSAKNCGVDMVVCLDDNICERVCIAVSITAFFCIINVCPPNESVSVVRNAGLYVVRIWISNTSYQIVKLSVCPMPMANTGICFFDKREITSAGSYHLFESPSVMSNITPPVK